jgi:large subunit ribosomal protein L20
MSRTKTSIIRRKRHKKVLDLTKGFRGTNNRLYKRAKEALLHSGQYAYVGRKLRKRDIRKLWITRITAGVRQIGESLNYSRFIKNLKTAKIELNRKMLSEIIVKDFDTFKEIVAKTQK